MLVHQSPQRELRAMPNSVGENQANRPLAGIDMLHIGSSDLSTEMVSPVNTSTFGCARLTRRPPRRPARKSMCVGGVSEDLEFQTRPMQLGMRYLTGGWDVGYVLSPGRADVRRLREVRLS